MRKRKSKAQLFAADGSGGMAEIHDYRFEQAEWPIRFLVPKERADTWFLYLAAECGRRQWNSSSFGQLQSNENSGTITITADATRNLQLGIIWERKRGGPIHLRARSVGTTTFLDSDASALFEHVDQLARAATTEKFTSHGQLQYEGLPWLGELWLSDNLRLGPPSRQDQTALIGPRIILVDALVDGIDMHHAGSAFEVLLRELSVFLSVVLRKAVRVPIQPTRVWTWTADSEGQVQCETRYLGYWEPNRSLKMQNRGEERSVPLKSVERPDFSLRGIRASDTELGVPADTVDLWRTFTEIAPNLRRQFLQAANMWQLALTAGHEHETTRVMWMVAACEALKPHGSQWRRHNIYYVVEALLGTPIALALQEKWFRPQDIRSAHIHGGEFRGSEFTPRVFISSFHDPTFDEGTRILANIVSAAIIEWLLRRATFSMAPLRKHRSLRRWVKSHPLLSIAIALAAGLGIGLAASWAVTILRFSGELLAGVA